MTNIECLKAAVEKQIAGNKDHGWGAEDSTEVIMALIANETGGEPSDLAELKPLIKSMVNPSQARQIMETKGLLNEAKKGSRKVAGGLKSFLG